jgi:ribosomal protein S18 acetylase RimI-like enzyme
MFTVRDMKEADLDASSLLAEELVKLHHAWDRTRFFIVPDVAKGYRRWFASQLGQEGVLLLVAESEGEIAGYLYGSLEERDWAALLDEHAAIHDIHVSSKHRRKGIARALMAAAAERFKKLGAARIVLSTATQNVEGQSLFKSVGYRPTMVEMTLDLG